MGRIVRWPQTFHASVGMSHIHVGHSPGLGFIETA